MGRIYSEEVRLLRSIRRMTLAVLCLALLAFAIAARVWWVTAQSYVEAARTLQEIRQDVLDTPGLPDWFREEAENLEPIVPGRGGW